MPVWLLLLLVLVPTAAAQEALFPGLGVALDLGNGTLVNTSYTAAAFSRDAPAGPWRLATAEFSAVVTRAADNYTWLLAFVAPRHRVARLSFPMLPGTPLDGQPGTFTLLPMLGGIFVAEQIDCPLCSLPQMVYPGSFHAPYVLVCRPPACLMAAATTWPPHTTKPDRTMHSGQPRTVELRFQDGYAANETVRLSVQLGYTHDDPRAGTAWQQAVLRYRAWLVPHWPAAPIQPVRMLQSEGMLSVGLENMPGFNLTALNATWFRWRDFFGRMQMWGQMSNWCGDPARAVPPLQPGEQTGCCMLQQTMHPRYLAGVRREKERMNEREIQKTRATSSKQRKQETHAC